MRNHIGVGHMKDRNYIHWDITTKCNFSCEYCYAMKEYGSSWNKETKKETIDGILKAIEISTLPVFLGLLGGEPTSSKYFMYILEYVKTRILKKNSNSRMYITSNLSKSNTWFNEFNESGYFNNKLFWLCSYHDGWTNKNLFLMNIKILLQKGYRVKVNLMIPQDKNRLTTMNEIINGLTELTNSTSFETTGTGELIIHPHFIYDNEHKLKSYPNEVFEFFGGGVGPQSMSPKEFIQDGILYNDSEIFNKHLNKFKGWTCFLNNYEINLNGDVHKFCVGGTGSSNLLQDPFYFRRIPKTEGIICEHSACTCDGLLKTHKTKEV